MKHKQVSGNMLALLTIHIPYKHWFRSIYKKGKDDFTVYQLISGKHVIVLTMTNYGIHLLGKGLMGTF